jgi:hypothetical protein
MSTDSTGTVCTSRVRGWADPAVRSYLFGAPFATSAYIAYHAQKNQVGDQIGVAPRAEADSTTAHPSISVGTLVAAILASVFGVAFFASLLLFYIRRRRAPSSDAPRSKRKAKNEHTIEPFTSRGSAPPHSATPLISIMPGQGGWIIEQGPIGGEPGSGGVLLTREQWSLSNNPSPRLTGASGKTPLPAPSLQLGLVRHSQMGSTSTISLTLEPSPHQESDPLIPSPLRGSQRYHSPGRSDELAPPPYTRNSVL